MLGSLAGVGTKVLPYFLPLLCDVAFSLLKIQELVHGEDCREHYMLSTVKSDSIHVLAADVLGCIRNPGKVPSYILPLFCDVSFPLLKFKS